MPGMFLQYCDRPLIDVDCDFGDPDSPLKHAGFLTPHATKKLAVEAFPAAAHGTAASVLLEERTRAKELEVQLQQAMAKVAKLEADASQLRLAQRSAEEQLQRLKAARYEPLLVACASFGASSALFLTRCASAVLDLALAAATRFCGEEPGPVPAAASIRKAEQDAADSPPAVVALDEDGDEYSRVFNVTFGAVPGSLGRDFIPVSICRVKNSALRATYEALRCSFSSCDPDAVNERLLFHGTGQTPPNLLVESSEGFNVGNTTTGCYGRGWYFAVSPSYCHSHAHCFEDGDTGHRLYQQLICRVLCGRVKSVGRDAGSFTSLELQPKECDSVMGGPHGRGANSSMVHVVYRGTQVFPEFVVTYRRKPKQQSAN